MSRSFLTALLALCLSAGAALAQSWGNAPAPIWSGLYLGAHGGGGWGSSGAGDAIDLSGGLGGLHGGYQWQTGNFVFGAEGEVSFGDISGELTEVERMNFFGTPITSRLKLDVSTNTVASLKGRLGYVAGPVLLYATGGIAWSWLDLDASATATGGGLTMRQSISGSDVITGYTVGGGAEMKFTSAISGRLDVSHYRFDGGFDDGRLNIGNIDTDFTVVRGGLTFHLN